MSELRTDPRSDPGARYHFLRTALDTVADRRADEIAALRRTDRHPILLFDVHGQCSLAPRQQVLRVWEEDPDNTAEDIDFIRELKIDNHDGSLFALMWENSTYSWVRHVPRRIVDDN